MQEHDLLREYFLFDTYHYLYPSDSSQRTPKQISQKRNQQFSLLLISSLSAYAPLSPTKKRYILGGCLARGCTEEFVNHLLILNIVQLEQAIKQFAHEHHSNLVALVYQIIKACYIDGHTIQDDIPIVTQISEWVSIPTHTLDAVKLLCEQHNAQSKQLRELCGF